MGRTPRGSGEGLNKGAWTASEDKLLIDYVRIHGEGRWSRLSRETGLKRCGKSCRLRWMNYLRPNIKRGNISPDEEELIVRLHKLLGNRWSLIAGRLPGRTDNEIKNYWNTNIAKKKPELLLSRPAQPRNLVRNSGSNPQRIDDCQRAAPLLEQTNNAVTAALQQTAEINQSHDAKLPKAGLSSCGLPSRCDAMLMKDVLLSDSDYHSEGSLSLMSSPEDNPMDFMLDFTVDDLCQILDSDFSRFVDVNLSNDDGLGAHGLAETCNTLISPPNEGGNSIGGQFRETGISGFHSLDSFFGSDDEKWVGDDVAEFHPSGKEAKTGL